MIHHVNVKFFHVLLPDAYFSIFSNLSIIFHIFPSFLPTEVVALPATQESHEITRHPVPPVASTFLQLSEASNPWKKWEHFLTIENLKFTATLKVSNVISS